MSRIVLLHGPSSSGKSTLARAVLEASDTPFLRLSIDTLRDGGALFPASRSLWAEHRPKVFDGLHHAIAAFADAGNDLIVEHIFDSPGWHGELAALLKAHRVVFVGLLTAPDVLAAREVARGDRQPGSALADSAHVHLGRRYDLELDGVAPPQVNAAEVLAALSRMGKGESRFFDAPPDR
ncbi:chloramphenicol phosphotransferase CPT family protein [Litorisediminicola beolgyonensis]|uniref:Chloramphenicol phosphotransferase CPT family protein n=1 Tax=Litorisediminicola beolgyonensis TaxID=1173614 RepID=A0ABW3ZNL6_9RHOB